MKKTVSCVALLAVLAAAGFGLGVREGTVYMVPSGTSAQPERILVGVSVGPVTFSMNRDQVIKALGKPETIYFGDTRFSLRDSPVLAWNVFPRAGLSILFQWDQIVAVSVLSEMYEYGKGIRVGMNGTTMQAILGPLPTDDIPQSSGGRDTVYSVFHSSGASYRLGYYEDNRLFLKVSSTTNRVTEILLPSPTGEVFAFNDFWLNEPVEPSTGTEVRRQLAKVISPSVLPSEQYCFVPYAQEVLRAADNYPIYPKRMSQYWFVSKALSSDEILAREKAFDTAFATYTATWPAANEIIARAGLPLSFEAADMGGASIALSIMLYGDTRLLFGVDGKLATVYFSGRTTYKANGRIGVGSTREEVFAEFGMPLKVVEAMPYTFESDRVLYSFGETRTVEYIRYEKAGFQFWFSSGKVGSFSREWRQSP